MWAAPSTPEHPCAACVGLFCTSQTRGWQPLWLWLQAFSGIAGRGGSECLGISRLLKRVGASVPPFLVLPPPSSHHWPCTGLPPSQEVTCVAAWCPAGPPACPGRQPVGFPGCRGSLSPPPSLEPGASRPHPPRGRRPGPRAQASPRSLGPGGDSRQLGAGTGAWGGAVLCRYAGPCRCVGRGRAVPVRGAGPCRSRCVGRRGPMRR